MTVTENLRHRFFDRLRPHFAPSHVRRIELAYILAKYSHRAQVRKELDEHGDPVRYFEHVRRATLIGIDVAGIVRLDTIIASVLHDTFEDTRLSPELVEDCFGAGRVRTTVRVLSKVPGKEATLPRSVPGVRRLAPVLLSRRATGSTTCARLATTSPELPQEAARRDHEQVLPAVRPHGQVLAPPEHQAGVSRLNDLIHREVATVSALDRVRG